MIRFRAVALGLSMALAGCPKAPPPAATAADPVAALERARAEATPGPVYAPFNAVITTPDQRLTVAGSLVVAAPDRFRIELRGPIGPPQVVITSDGKAAQAYVAPKNTYYTSNDASAALAGFLGINDVNGAALVASLLLGRVPALPGMPSLNAAGQLVWSREDGASITITMDEQTAHLATAEAYAAEGNRQFRADWTPGPFPVALRAELPTIHSGIDLKFGDWQAAAPTDAAFVLVIPEGSKVVPLAAP